MYCPYIYINKSIEIIKMCKSQQLMLINNNTSKKQIKSNVISQPQTKSKPKSIIPHNKNQMQSMNNHHEQQQYAYHHLQGHNDNNNNCADRKQFNKEILRGRASGNYNYTGNDNINIKIQNKSQNKSQSKSKNVKLRNNLKVKDKQSKSKQKDKNRVNKIIRQEYYIGESGLNKDKDKYRGNKNKVINKDKVKQKDRIIWDRQKCYNNNQNNQINEDDDNPDLIPSSSTNNLKKTSQQIQKINRTKIPQLKTVITFQGKIIKIPPKNRNQYQHVYHNYTSLSSHQDGLTINQQFTNQRLRQKKIKVQSKSNNRSKDKGIIRDKDNKKTSSSKSTFKSVFKSNNGKQSKNKHSYSQQLIPSSSSPQHPYPYPCSSNNILHKSSYNNQFQNQPSTSQIHKTNLLIQQTQVSPFLLQKQKQKQQKQKQQYERSQKFDFEQIYQLIQQDIKSVNQIKISSNSNSNSNNQQKYKNINKQRKLCIKFMSEICGEIGLRRDTFYLGISIFDRVLSKKIIIQNYVMLALVCLTLAMKLEQARLAEEFVYVLSIVNTGRESYLESVSSCRSQSKPKSMPHRKSKQKMYKNNNMQAQTITKISNNNINTNNNKDNKKMNNYMKICVKQENINMRKISLSNITKILRKYNCTKISKLQFMSLQQKITIYLRFRLWRIQAIFWADLLTCLWDQHIIAQSHSHASSQSRSNTHSHSHTHTYSNPQNLPLLFRSSQTLQNITHLYNLLQLAYQCPQIYTFPSIYIVLSAIYLIIRITKQNNQSNNNNNSNNNNKNVVEYYKQSLSNSTNILFVDRSGVNQIFWVFINKIRIQMVDILGSCQFISRFLGQICVNNDNEGNQGNENKNINNNRNRQCKCNSQQQKINFQQKNNYQSLDHLLSIHQHKPDLYSNII